MGERFWRQLPAYATHIAEIRSQGVDFAPVDVLDRAERPEDYVKLPIPDGANLKEIEVCRAMLEDYGGIVVLTNFKIPSFAGYTGAVKNIGIGLASPDGKAPVHEPGYQRSEAFFTNLADAVKGIKARMGRKMIAISILSNIHAEPFGGAAPKTGNLGIIGSLDPVAADQAACDLIWQLPSHFSIMSTNRALQPPLPAALRPYEDVMKLLAAFSGPNCEVVLHDLSDPVHSVVRVENGEVTGRAVGQGLRHLVPNLLRMPRTDDGGLSSESPNLLPVYWLRSRGRLIRALSLLIRDDAGEVVGVLCINQDVTNVSAAAGQLQALLALLPPGEASILPEASASADALASEHAAAQLASAVSRNTEAKDLQKDSDIELEGSVLKTVYAMIDRMTERVRAGRSSSAVLTREERLPLVRFMDTRGVFLVKGALDYAAERLGVSKVTLYSDLDLLRRESESAGSLASGRQKK